MNAIKKGNECMAILAATLLQSQRARAAFLFQPPQAPALRQRIGQRATQAIDMGVAVGMVQVVPCGKNFFHLQDATGRVLGYRVGHLRACAAARDLEQHRAAV